MTVIGSNTGRVRYEGENIGRECEGEGVTMEQGGLVRVLGRSTVSDGEGMREKTQGGGAREQTREGV